MTTITADRTSTIDTSRSLANTPLANDLLITRRAATPPGDPVLVDLATLTGTTPLASVTVSHNATVRLGSRVAAIGPATRLIIDGGTLEIAGSALTAPAPSVIVDPAGGALRIGWSGSPTGIATVAVRFSAGIAPASFTIDFPGAASVNAVYDATTMQTTIGDGVALLGGAATPGRTATLAGNPFDITVAPGRASGVTTFPMSDGGSSVLTCFLPGVLIATPDGERAVETLRAGDSVLAIEHGRQVIRRLVWAGSQPVAVPEDDRCPSNPLPVRIRRDALADGVPHTDLLVTPEHCLLLDGRLVPARMLVNGRSILIEIGMRDYTAYHVETEPHAIIMANGAPTESYLDTGNRSLRTAAGIVVRRPTATKSWARDAAAPLEVSREIVEPLWQALAARAERLGCPAIRAAAATLTDEPDLCLVSEEGGEILPLCVHDGRALFLVPGTLGAAWLRSRSARPCEAIGPFVDDRRQLGLLVGEVAVWKLESRRLLRHHLAIKTLIGWHAPEADHCRWTDGNALLPLAPDPDAPTLLVELQILGGGPYPIEPIGTPAALATAA